MALVPQSLLDQLQRQVQIPLMPFYPTRTTNPSATMRQFHKATSQIFSNLQGSTQTGNYLGLYTMTSFDTITCQQYCDAADGCYAFNIYIERDPSINPADSCPDPASTMNYKCTLWGAPIDSSSATNTGQWRNQFQVAITASNGYNKNAPPPSYTDFTGPTEFGGALNAPSGYIIYKFFPGDYDPSKCADACQQQTAYDSAHPRSDGTYDACNFFNSYVQSDNNSPQGTYCGLYTEPWDKQYSTNYGYSSGSDRFSISSSYGYTLNTQDPGQVSSSQ